MGRVFSPLDEELGLLAGKVSPALAANVARLGASLPFAQVKRLLASLSGVQLSVSTIRRVAVELGAAAVAVEESAVQVLEEEGGEAQGADKHLQVSVDGAMVPLRGDQKWGEVRTLAIGELAPKDGRREAKGISYFSRLCDHSTFNRLATVETWRRGTAEAQEVVAVNDGAVWIDDFLATHCPKATRVLDWAHASSYAHAAGHALQGENGCKSWCRLLLQELREGDPKNVLALLGMLIEEQAEGDPVREVLENAHSYLAKRVGQIRYREFVAAGYPIGSGMVESANKLLVEARLKGPGMHWKPSTVNAMLALRCAESSSHWEATASVAFEALAETTKERRTSARARRCEERKARQKTSSNPPHERPAYFKDGRPTPDHPYKRFPAVRPRHH